MTSEAGDLTGGGRPFGQRSLSDRAVAAFRSAAGTPRPRPTPHQVRATKIAAQILEVAPPTPRPAVPDAPPDYVPKPHPIRTRRRTGR